MSRIFVHGLGAVSPAGWDVAALSAALKKNIPLPAQNLTRPGREKPLAARVVPSPVPRPAFLAHPRLRRANLLTQFVVAAALEALGGDTVKIQSGEFSLGIVVGLMAGCVNYSRRFYEEVLRDPATASPLLFPETVFNSPASHLGAYLGARAANYTLVGDDGVFLQGIALAAQWLADEKMDACLVIGAEETDWIVADAIKLFARDAIHGAGAGAMLLKKNPDGALAELVAVTDSFPFATGQNRFVAAQKMRAQLPAGAPDELLCASAQKIARADAAETAIWRDWPGARLAPKSILGEAFAASAAWQCVAAGDALRQNLFAAANVSVIGANQQAIGARFANLNS